MLSVGSSLAEQRYVSCQLAIVIIKFYNRASRAIVFADTLSICISTNILKLGQI